MYIGRNPALASVNHDNDEDFMFTEIQSMLRVREGRDVPLDLIKADYYQYLSELYRKSHKIDKMLRYEAANDVDGKFS